MLKPIKAVDFSAEGGTIARYTGDYGPVPLIVASTDVEQAHKLRKEFITFDQLNSQFGIYSEALNFLKNRPIKRASGISVSDTLQNFSIKEKLDYQPFMEYLDWFDAQQENQPFAILRAERRHLSEEDLEKFKKKLSDFSEILGLYPIVVTDIQELECETPSKRLVYDRTDKIYDSIKRITRNGEIPLVFANKEDVARACDEISINPSSSPLKYIYIEKNGGILPVNGAHGQRVISRIDFNKILGNSGVIKEIDETELVGLLKEDRLSMGSYQSLHEAYSHFAFVESKNSIPARKRKLRSIQIVSLDDLYKELFTVEGAGTLLRRGYDIEQITIEDPASSKKYQIFYERDNQSKEKEPNIRSYLSGAESELGYMITSKQDIAKKSIIKIDRFEIARDFWKQDLPERLLEEVLKQEKPFYWVASKGTLLYENSQRLLESLKFQGQFTGEDRLPGSNVYLYLAGLNPQNRDSYLIRSKVIENLVQEGIK